MNTNGNVRRRKNNSTQKIHIGFAEDKEIEERHTERGKTVLLSDDEETEEQHTERGGTIPLSLLGDDGNPPSAMSTLGQSRFDVYHSCTQKVIKWVPKASGWNTPKLNGLFAILTITALVLSGGSVTLSCYKQEDLWTGISQMILYIFQAYCACRSRRRFTKPRSDEEDSGREDVKQTPGHLWKWMVAGATCSIVSASVYPYNARISTVVSFVANLCQVGGIISIDNASDDTFAKSR